MLTYHDISTLQTDRRLAVTIPRSAYQTPTYRYLVGALVPKNQQ